MIELEKERNKLKETISIVKRLIDVEKKELENLQKNFFGDINELNMRLNIKSIHR